MILLRLLGSLALVREDGTSVRAVLNQPKRFALLAYLAAFPPRSEHRRDTLLALFWPELDEEHARKALRQSLYGLRQSLGATALTGQGQLVGVDPERLWCDAAVFSAAVKDSRDEEALDLYAGPFLSGFHLSGMPEFERWVEGERRRLELEAVEAAWRLADAAGSEDDKLARCRWAERALELAPYDEESLRRYLELMGSLGQPAAAVRAYEAYTVRLAEDLQLEPSPETAALLARVRAGDVEPASARPSATATPARPSGRVLPTRVVPPPPPAGPLPVRRRRVHRLARRAAGVALLLMAGVVASIVARGGAELEPGRILVIPFDNRTGESGLDPVGMIAADWIVQGLARTDVVDVVPSAHALALLRQVENDGVSDGGVGPAGTVAHALGAGTMVVGSYHRRGEDLEFQAQVVDAGGGRLLHAVDGVRGRWDDPMSAIEELRRRTVGAVAFEFDARTFPMRHDGVRPPAYEAYRVFATGMDARNRGLWRQAAGYFHEAFAIDTSFTAALFMAALDHLNLRELAQADSLIRLLGESRQELPTVERLLVDWAETLIRGDLEGALEAARALDRVSEEVFRAHVAHSALSANRPGETVVAYRGYFSRPQPHALWNLAYARRLTDAHHRLGSHRRELAEARRARHRHPDLVEPVLLEMRALIGLGRVRQARERLEEALARPPESRWPPGEILVRAADELRAHGHPREAGEILTRGLAWYRALPVSQVELLRHRRYRAAAMLRADSLDAAEAAFRQLAAEFPEDPFYMASVAVALARRGDRQAASRIAETVLDRNPPYDYGHHIYSRARIAAQLGYADEAVTLLRLAFANGFDFAFVGGARLATSATMPDGSPHLDPAFDGLRAHPGFLELARGKDATAGRRRPSPLW